MSDVDDFESDSAATGQEANKPPRAPVTAALAGVVTRANEFCCDGGTAIVAFARRFGIAAHNLPNYLG